jgi:homopolymeric O-antigen transport system permease protein
MASVNESALEPAAYSPASGPVEARQPVPTPALDVQVILPSRSWQAINVGELWRFRELLFFLAWRDVKVRYKQTALGAAWAILQPALMMVVFTIFFRRMANVPTDDIPYPLFSYAGLVAWTFFATAITSAGNSVVGSERMITKIYFPRLAIPFAAVGAAVVDFVIALSLLLAMMIYYGIAPGPGLLLVPPLLALLMLAALGVGTALAALNVYYRDFKYVIPFLVQIWMFATPSVYMQPKKDADSLVQTVLAFNPVNAFVAAFRNAVLTRTIDWGSVALAGVSAAVAFLLGCFYFRKVEDQFADFI